MPDDAHSVSITVAAGLYGTISRARAVAFFANLLFLPLELGIPAIVEIAQSNTDFDLNVMSARLSSLVVATSAKETTKQVKWVVVVSATLTALLQAIVSVLVVYLSRLWID